VEADNNNLLWRAEVIGGCSTLPILSCPRNILPQLLPLRGMKAKVKYHIPFQGIKVNEKISHEPQRASRDTAGQSLDGLKMRWGAQDL